MANLYSETMSHQLRKAAAAAAAVSFKEEEAFLATASFPKKLYDLIVRGDPEVVRWEEQGNAFRIVNPEEFSRTVLPKYFRRK